MIPNKYIVSWLNICLILISILIVVGGITRLTNSGLSIVNWKPIMGIFPPVNKEQWQDSFSHYQQTPEFKNYHSSFTIKEYKQIFFWEYLHRMLGRLVGLTFLFPLIFFNSKKYFTKHEFRKLVYIFLLICLQGLMGWIMVKSGLVGEGDVSPYRLAIHLGMAMLIVGSIYLMKLNFKYGKDKIENVENNLIDNVLVIMFVQLILGAVTAGYGVGKEFLNGDSIFIMKNILSNGAFFIQFSHILLGTIFLIATMFFSRSMINIDKIFPYSNSLSYIVLFQYFVGILNLIQRVPLSIGLIHQFLVIIILLLIIKIKFLISNK